MFKKIVLFAFVCAVVSFVVPQSVLGIGQMTEPIIFEDILRGQEIFETLILFNSEGEDVVFHLEATDEINGWATFYDLEDKNLETPLTKVTLVKESRLRLQTKFEVPSDIPNGTYSGAIAVIKIPEASEADGVSTIVKQRVDREVSITITDQEVIALETTIIPEKYAVKKDESLKVKVFYHNKGNIVIKPNLEIKVIRINDNNTVFNAIFPYPDNEESVKPLEKKEFIDFINWSTIGQEKGKYRVNLNVLLDGGVVEEHSFRLVIGSVISSDVNGFLSFIAFIGGGNLTLSWFIIGIVILIIAGVLFFINKRRNR